MNDLISRAALLREFETERHDNDLWHITGIKAFIENAPAVDAKPVVRGEWKFNHFYDEWECSQCGSLIALSDDENGHPNFCPECGADMRKKGERYAFNRCG